MYIYIYIYIYIFKRKYLHTYDDMQRLHSASIGIAVVKEVGQPAATILSLRPGGAALKVWVCLSLCMYLDVCV